MYVGLKALVLEKAENVRDVMGLKEALGKALDRARTENIFDGL